MIRTVGIVSKPRKEELRAVVPPLVKWLERHKLAVLSDQETAECVPGLESRAREELGRLVDLVIVLGGDGTLLATARALGDAAVPILPVNLGGLGFLTSVTLDDLYPVLEQALAGRHRTSERMLLEAQVLRGGAVAARHRALNDAVLNKAAVARMIEFDLHIDGVYVCRFRSDGLILSTPTGSTAYSLSAGGPIVYPLLDSFVITPICPHTLTNRPLVVPDRMKIEVEFEAGEESVYLTLDGQLGVELQPGDRVAVHKAAHKVRLVRPERRTYFEILRNKLKWGGR